MIGNSVSLEDIHNSNLDSRLNFSITFDDVSNSIYDSLKWLNKKGIPFALCPCQKITEELTGWRDKVYFIEKYSDSNSNLKAIIEKFPKEKFDAKDGFYNLTKNPRFNQDIMINDVIEPLYKSILKKDKFGKNYFDNLDLIQLKKSLII